MDVLLEAVKSVLIVLFSPRSTDHVNWFFGSWTVIYLIINICWDAWSKHTLAFSMRRLKAKIEIVFQAGTFAGGLLLFISALQPSVKQLLLSSHIALLLPGLVCLLHSLSNLSPVPTKDDN